MPLDDRDAAYLADMLEAGHDILEFMGDVAYDILVHDRMRCRAVEREFEILGEAARRLSTAFRNKYPDLPLTKVIALRNVIAHGYAEVDYRVLFRVARDDLSDLLERLQGLLPPRVES